MASIESEVLDPAAAIDGLRRAASELALSRRNFMGLGIAGAAAAGAALLSEPSAVAQEPLHNGYPQVDVLNFLLQVKYVTATLYSYITQGTDLPPSSGITVGTAQVYNAPSQITFTGAANGPTGQQLTDLFNEMYYDELNHVIDLRNLVEAASAGQAVGSTAVVGRANLDLSGASAPAKAPSSTTATISQSQAVAVARLLEDLSVSAAAGALIYLSGTNLAYVTQMMAADGFHAGSVRLAAIQIGAQYQPSGFQFGNVTTSAETLGSISAFTTAGSSTMYAMNLGAAVPAAGNIVLGTGLSPANSVLTNVVNLPAVTPAAVTAKGSTTLTSITSTAGILPGQPITGANIPANSYVKSTTSNTITISAAATAATAPTALTGAVVSGSNVVLNPSNAAASLIGDIITGAGIPANTTVTAVGSSPNTITLSANATASSAVALTGTVASGSNVITAVSSIAGVIVGLPISGAGIPAGAVVSAASGTTITISIAATASGTGIALNCITTEALSIPTEIVTVGQSSITIAGKIAATSILTLSIIQTDPMDVIPADPGSASISAAGPQLLPSSSPSAYQGFFNTAGSGSASATGTPAGLLFARNFSQVLQVLLDTNSTNSTVTNQSSEGGFYPYGVSGTINSIQPF